MLTQMASFAYNHHDALLSKFLISRQLVGRNLFDPFGISKTEVDLLSVSGFHISIYLGKEFNRISNLEFFKAFFVHPNVVFFSVKHTTIEEHAECKNALKAHLVFVDHYFKRGIR